ncbi:hypothetical protein N9948_01370 [bacterium]|nr:hypothetical protein [bacterium]
MIDAPVIFPIDDPVSSLSVHLDGSGSIDTSGFIFSPSGGDFASGFATSGYAWSYDFNLMQETEVFSIAAFDASGDVSPSASVIINYELQPPIILTPGQAKSITDDTSATGSTEDTFVTLVGDFNQDGVIIGDYVLGISGKNSTELKEVNQVEDTYLVTEPFPFPWESGDKIKIFNDLDRATYHANQLYFQSTGIVDESAQSVLYTTCGFEPITVYAELPELYEIDSSNDLLHFIVDGEEVILNLTHGSDITAQEIIDEINSYFSKDVAFIEQPNILLPAVFFIRGIKVNIVETTGSIYFEICPGDFLFANTLAATGTIGPTDDCDIVLQDSDSRTIDVNIDGNIVRVTLPEQEELNPIAIAEELNSQSGKCIASAGTSSVVLLGSNTLNVNQDLPFLGLDACAEGLANVNNNAGDINSDFNLDFTIFGNDFTLTVIAEDPFGNRTEESTLDVNYQIDPPTLGEEIINAIVDDQIESSQDIYTLLGNYDIEGASVQINGVVVFTSNGGWTVDQPLVEGENILNIATIDIFGTPSNLNTLNANYTNPNTTPVVLDNTGAGLQWRSITSPSFAPEDVRRIMEAINDILDPIIGFLDAIASLLKIVRAFIVDTLLAFLNVIRNAIQSFIDDILEVLRDLVNGAGIFICSTIPKAGDVRDAQDFFDQIQIGFDGFVDTLAKSFDDPLDPFRPQLSDNITTGGYVLAVADTGGIVNFLNAIKQIQQIVEKEILDYALSYPKNLKISNENQRCVITWTSPDGLRPGAYEIRRSKVSGGEEVIKKVKIGNPRNGQNSFVDESKKDKTTGELDKTYPKIGTLNDTQVLKEFRFIDGIATGQENSEASIGQQVIDGTINALDAFRDGVLVVQGSTNAPLVNGQTYFYKVIPTYLGADDVGQSFELLGTPQNPELIFVEEFLNDQIKKANDPSKPLGTTYILSGAIFDDSTAVFADDPSHLEVLVDGGVVPPENIIYNKGLVYLKEENIPKSTIKFSYWTKKEINATRARLTGTEQGEFTFKKNDPDGNTLEILVGPKSSQASNLGTGTTGATTLSLAQKITFVRDFRGGEELTLPSDEVVSIIRTQTAGLKVTIDRFNRIVLIDDQNVNPYLGSKLEIKKGNRVLGFSDTANQINPIRVTNYISEAGPIGGTPPDWFRVSVADLFPVINDMVRYIENTAQNFLKSLESASLALVDFIDLLLKKIEALSDIAKRLRDLIEEALNILTIKGGFWFLQIPAQPGGNAYLQESLLNSTGRPDSDYAAGVMFVYGDGATQKAIDFIFKPVK